MIPSARAHGGDGLAVAQALGLDPADVVDLSMSMNPFAPDVSALAAEHVGTLRHYPCAADATAALAAALGVDRRLVLLTNGGSEAIGLVGGHLGGTVAAEPEFGLHPRSGTGPLWRSNPNNPLGRLAGDDERADVWDEAFYPLAAGSWTRGDPDAVVVGSLTKVFGCPGLRLGYVLAENAASYAATQPAWSVNSLALALLPVLLDLAELSAWAQRIAVRRTELSDLLTTHGLTALPSDAPWVLVRAPGLREELAPYGVIVRDCASFGLPHHARIAVPDERGLELLGKALTCVAPC
jgi:histidinol-phosphate/aromatic aminotransferase/cobyric acid decarboxylase-like protein